MGGLLLVLPLAAIVMLGPLKWRLVALGLGMSLSSLIVAAGILTVPWFLTLLFIVRYIADLGFRPVTGADSVAVVSRVLPVVILLIYNIFLVCYSAYMFPDIAETMPGSAQFKIRNAVPLAQQPESFNQAIYLAVCIFFLIVLAASLLKKRDEIEDAVLALIYAALIGASVWYFWHFFSLRLGVPFLPGELLHTDPTRLAWKQAVGGIARPAGSFAEPSGVAAFYISLQFFFFEMYLARGRGRDVLCWLVTLLALFVSTSTSAYAGMAMFFAWMVMRIAMGGAAMSFGIKIPTQKIQQAVGLAIGASVVAGVIGVFFVDWEAVQTIYEVQIANKSTSSSAEERGYANFLSAQIFQQSYGLGVGLGNHRSSSLLMTILSGVGIVGFALFFYFVGSTGLRCMLASSGEASGRVGFNWAVATATGAHAAGMLIAAGELQSPLLWTWMGIATAVIVAHSRRRRHAFGSLSAPAGGSFGRHASGPPGSSG